MDRARFFGCFARPRAPRNRPPRGRRAAALLLAFVQAFVLVAVVVRPLPARAAVCSLFPGKDGAGGTLSGAYNTYYQPPTGTLAAGSTTVSLGTMDTGNQGATTAVAAGDLLLIIQMQDGSFTYTNSSAYGNGSGSGYTSIGQAGLYEYVAVESVAGSTATILGAGGGGGLINSYVEGTANTTHGQQTYQIIRVPQYVTAQLSSTFRSAYWDGKTGGVAALDVASTLNLGGASIYATGNGFRGGGLTESGTSPAAVLNNDWVDSATMNAGAPAFGSKGEGVMGTPDYVFEYTSFTTPSTPATPTIVNAGANGYPGGDQGRGAPGNAGGGGNDMNPNANDENTGGGGGGNGGTGGNGGYPWTPVGYSSGNNPSYYVDSPGQHTATSTTSAVPDATHNPDIGGRGAAAVTPSVTRVFMGGGGGAGSNNNGSNNNASNAYGSSGGVGGGIVMMRIATASSGATIYARGTTGLAPDNDGGGGGGAGGTVMITSPSAFSGVTVNVSGAAGTTAAATASDNTYAIQHGPGGGGGGGAVLSSSAVTATLGGGANGTTTSTYATAYGATAGATGVTQTVLASQVPGVASGAECYNAASPGPLFNGPVGAPSQTGSYDGVVATNNNDDFTAKAFVPAGAPASAFINADTSNTPMVFTGSAIAYGATVNVQNQLSYGTTTTTTITLTGTAPAAPAGWTVRICPDNAGVPNCATGGNWTQVGTAGATATSKYSWPGNTAGSLLYWAVYSAPVNVVAFTRYDGSIAASDGTTTNTTHDEIYPGFLALKKTYSVLSTGCPPGITPGTTGACPGGSLVFRIDYKNLAAAGLTASSIVVTEPGSGGTTNWTTYSNGLADALTSGGSVNGTSVFGATTAGTTFTGNTVGSMAFSATIGGGTGLAAGASGSLYFRVVVK